MLKELFEKYLKRKKEVGPEVVQVVETEPKEEFDITISRDDHVLKVEISDYVKMVDYYERMKAERSSLFCPRSYHFLGQESVQPQVCPPPKVPS